METSRKKERLMLALGLSACVCLLAAHYFSGIARKLSSDSDLAIALLGGGAPRVFIYHPFSRTVTVVNLPASGRKAPGSAYQKACAALALVSGKNAGPAEDVFYVAADGGDLSGFYAALNSWRARPGLFFGVARRIWLIRKEERTNISFYGLLQAALELSRLNSSNFIVTDYERESGRAPGASGAEHAGPGEDSSPRAAIRVEVLNASGRKDLAGRVTKHLRKKGFDVINFGTHGSAAKQTKIVNCSNNVEAARAVRSALGLGAQEIYSKPGIGAVVEVSVVLGTDFDISAIK